MACCSNCGCQYIVELPDNPVETYTAANLNVGGVGVYDSTTSNEFGFRGIISDNAALTVALDAANFTINLDLDIPTITAQLPQATTAVAGIGETATDAEAQAKASTTVFVTPSNFASMGSTTAFAGLVELATNAETQAGASATLAVTPAGLASVTATQQVTQVFADAVARAAATPLFEGQYGYQSDTNQAYIGTAVAAGSWNPLITDAVTNTLTSDTYVDLSAANFIFQGGNTFVVDSVFAVTGAVTTFQGAYFEFLSTVLNIDSSTFQIGAVDVPANSVLITSGVAGDLSSSLISTFLSTANTQTGYTTFANPATLRTCDTATVTLPQLAQIVGTLIEDLKAVQLPAT